MKSKPILVKLLMNIQEDIIIFEGGREPREVFMSKQEYHIVIFLFFLKIYSINMILYIYIYIYIYILF